jgi:hypothetical protein
MSAELQADRQALLSAVVPIAKETWFDGGQLATHAHTHLDVFMFLFHRVSLGGGLHEISAQARRRESGRMIHVLQFGGDTPCRRFKERSTVAIVAFVRSPINFGMRGKARLNRQHNAKNERKERKRHCRTWPGRRAGF